MKNLFPLLFVIFAALFNEQGVCFMFYSCKEVVSNAMLKELKGYLFCTYDPYVRPTENYRNATIVNFGMHIQHFEVFDFVNIVDFHVWVKMDWVDPHLTWEPSHFDEIGFFHVKSHEIWTPDITIHSVTDAYVDVDMPSVECWLDHKGTVYCVPPMVYTTYCESDHTWWPYDLMNCTIQIGSWSYVENEIDLRLSEFETEGQLATKSGDKNTEWEVVHISHDERTIDSKFDLATNSKLLSYHVLLKRHSTMYGVIYIPLSVVLSTMTLITLWLEPRSKERMIIANLNFVLHLLFLQEIQWKLPFNGARPPELLIFCENSLILAVFSLMLTSILRYLQELTTDAPMWVSSTTVTILKSRVGQIFLVSILDPKVSARIETDMDDNTNLMSLDKKDSTWRYISILIGWLAFLSVLFVYIVMLIVYLPTSRSGSSF